MAQQQVRRIVRGLRLGNDGPAMAESPMMNLDCIRNALQSDVPRIHYDLTALLQHMQPEWAHDPENVMALVTLVKIPEGISRAEDTAHQIAQCVVIGLTENQVPTLEEALARTTQNMRDKWLTWPEAVRNTEGHREYIGVPPQAGAVAADANRRDATIDDIMRVVASVRTGGELKTRAIQVVTLGILTYCKRGVVSLNVCNRVSRALQEERGILVQIDPDVIRQIWSLVQKVMNAQMARAFFDLWEEAVGVTSMRLMLTIQQAKWQGLTNYQNILLMKERHPEFYWGILHALVPGEFTAFMRAHVEVGGDPYYGYNQDLDVVKSTNYPNLAFAAYRLAVECTSLRTFEQFLGGHKNASHTNEVDRLIRRYKDFRNNLDVGEDALAAGAVHVQAFRNLELGQRRNIIEDALRRAQDAANEAADDDDDDDDDGENPPAGGGAAGGGEHAGAEVPQVDPPAVPQPQVPAVNPAPEPRGVRPQVAAPQNVEQPRRRLPGRGRAIARQPPIRPGDRLVIPQMAAEGPEVQLRAVVVDPPAPQRNAN